MNVSRVPKQSASDLSDTSFTPHGLTAYLESKIISNTKPMTSLFPPHLQVISNNRTIADGPGRRLTVAIPVDVVLVLLLQLHDHGDVDTDILMNGATYN
jgi:hypothetical protein